MPGRLDWAKAEDAAARVIQLKRTTLRRLERKDNDSTGNN